MLERPRREDGFDGDFFLRLKVEDFFRMYALIFRHHSKGIKTKRIEHILVIISFIEHQKRNNQIHHVHHWIVAVRASCHMAHRHRNRIQVAVIKML